MNRCQRNILVINMLAVCTSSVLLLPIIVPYYRDVIGLSFRDFMIGEAIFSATIVAMEVPTGWLSDVWTRRKSLMLGVFVEMIGYFLILAADNMLMACLGQAVIGIGLSLLSGTISALLYDTLTEEGREAEFRKREGFRQALSFYTVAASTVIGAFLYTVDPMLPLVVEIAILACGIVVLAFLREPHRHRQAVHKHPLADMAQAIRFAVLGHPDVGGIIMVSAVLFCSTKLFMWSQQPYYELMSVPEHWYGLIMGAGFLMGAMGGQFGHVLFPDHWRNHTVMAILSAIACVLGLGAGLVTGWHGIPLLLCGTLIYGMANPHVQNAINRRVGGERRATILSAASLAVHFLFIPASLVLGAVSDAWGIGPALVVQAIILLLLAGFGLYLWSAKEKRHETSV